MAEYFGILLWNIYVMTTKCFSTPHKKKKNTPAYQTHPKHETEIEKKRKKNIGEEKRWVFLKYFNTVYVFASLFRGDGLCTLQICRFACLLGEIN